MKNKVVIVSRIAIVLCSLLFITSSFFGFGPGFTSSTRVKGKHKGEKTEKELSSVRVNAME